jgi:hypothetical protein
VTPLPSAAPSLKPATKRADRETVRALTITLALSLVLLAAANAASPRAEKEQLRPADISLAKRAALRQADVGPDWTRVKVPTEKDSQFACESFSPDFSAFTVTGKASASFQFTSPPGAQIDSKIAVFSTKAQAAGDFRLGAKPQLAGCLADQVRRAFRAYPKGIRGRLLSSRMVRAPRLGERAAAYAIKAELTGNGATLPVFVDVIAVQRGRSIAALIFTGLGSPMPSRQYFAAQVAGRMR